MYNLLSHRLDRLTNSGHIYLLRHGRKGIEREALRITPAGELSQTPHPVALGSALTHPNITTDYSEAQLELVTKPFATVADTISHLREIHHFTYSNLSQDELLWSTSMPCVLHGEESIPIAQFGTSNSGRFKHIYRRGLDVRYGRIMQAISGVHFNYSIAEAFWPLYQDQEGDRQAQQAFIDQAYFALLRNVLRYEWLITYLFGNTPALCRSFFPNEDTWLQLFDEHTYFAPYATSLRMSNIGYKNHMPSSLTVSYNSKADYVADLIRAVKTPHPPYVEAGVVVDGVYRQLSGNILQIENEFYSAVRPKQPPQNGERALVSLRDRGVGYIEVRALDVNTFDPLGFDATQAHFLETFLLFCLLHESPALTDAQRERNAHNQRQVAQDGRNPATHLRDSAAAAERPLAEWATELLNVMRDVAALLDDDTFAHSTAVAAQQAKVNDPEQTPSARMLRQMTENGESFFRFALRVSQEHAKTVGQQPQDPAQVKHYKELAQQSLEEQATLEKNNTQSFEHYLQDYFAQV